MTAAAKTGLNLFNIIVEEVTYCINTLKIIIVAYCTDAASDCRAMRAMLRERFPRIFMVDCWAHQV